MLMETPATKVERFRAERAQVTDVPAEMQTAIRLLAGPRKYGETTERAIERAAKIARLTYRTAKAFWYRERELPKERDVSLVRQAMQRMNDLGESLAADLTRFADDQEKAAHDEVRELRERVEALERMLCSRSSAAADFRAAHPRRNRQGLSARRYRAG